MSTSTSSPARPSATDGPPLRGETTSYHGQPILKETVWSWEIPTYFFTGGLAGGSAVLAYLAQLRGNQELSRRAWLGAMAGLAASPPLLISDLGRPERFLYMLRMFKVTSPMSVGSWILSAYGAAASLSALNAFTGRLPKAAVLARPAAATAGLGLSTYTAALLADTAVPAWHEARGTLPFVFGAGAAMSAAGAAAVTTPVASAAPVRRLAVGAAAAELASTLIMEQRLGMHGETYHSGKASRLAWLSRGCLTAGAALVAGPGARRRLAAMAGGLLLCAGAVATRFSVVEAGKASTADPRYVVAPQRRRPVGS